MVQDGLLKTPESSPGAGLFEGEIYKFAAGVLGSRKQAREAVRRVVRRLAEIRRGKGANGISPRMALHQAVWREMVQVMQETSVERAERRKTEEEERRKTMWVHREHYLEITDRLMPDSLVDHAENALSVLSDDDRAIAILKIYFGFPPADIATILERPPEGVEKTWLNVFEALKKELRKSQDSLTDPEPFLRRLRLSGPADSTPPPSAEPSTAPTQRMGAPTPTPTPAESAPAAEAPPEPKPTKRMPVPETPTRRFVRIMTGRTAQVMVGTLVAFAGLVAGIYVIVTYISRNAFQTAVNGIQANLEPVRLADVTLPSAPEEENAFPFYFQAAQAFRQVTAADDEALEKAIETMLAPGELDPAALRAAGQIVEARGADLKLLLDAAARPRYAPKIVLNRRTLTDLPHLRGLHSAVLVLAARAGIRARLRTGAAPSDDLAALFRLAAALRDEPTLAGQLLRVMVVRRATEALELCLNQYYFSRVKLGPIAAWINLDASADGVSRALQIERVVGVEAFHALFDGRDPGDPKLTAAASSISARLYNDAAYYLRAMTTVIGEAKKLREGGRPGFDPAASDGAGDGSVSGALLAPLRGWSESFARARAHEILARTAIELRLYKLMRGVYPAAAADLDWKPPVDPFAGKPIEYRREADGFLIYSAGPDGRDDGGSRDGAADLVIRVSK